MAVAVVAAAPAGRVVLVVAKMIGQLSVEYALDQTAGELLQEAVFAKEVFGVIDLFEQLVGEFFSDSHSLILHVGSQKDRSATVTYTV